jgi:signal transduction histidine kinase/PAS domain-containing protein
MEQLLLQNTEALMLAAGAASVALLVLFCLFVFALLPRRAQNDGDATLLASLQHTAFYYKDVSQPEAITSPALTTLLGLSARVSTVEQIASALEEVSAAKLTSALQELKDGKNNIALSLLTKTGGAISAHITAMNGNDGEMRTMMLSFHSFAPLPAPAVENNISVPPVPENSASAILDNAPYPIWRRDADLRIRFVNAEYLKIINKPFGYVSGEKGVEELTARAKDLAQKAMSTTAPQSEKHHVIVNGERRLHLLTEVPLPNGEGTAGFAFDITAQGELEKDLQTHMQAQSNLLESSRNAAAIYGTDKRLKFYNNAFLSLWKLDEKDLKNEPTYGEVLEQLRQRRLLPEQVDFKAFRTNQMEKFTNLREAQEEIMYLPNGMVVREIAIPYSLGGLLFSYEDLTERITLEQKHNTLIAVKRATIDNLYEGICVFGEDGRLQLHNPSYAAMWQLDPEVLAGMPHMSDILEKTKRLYEYNKDWDSFKQKMVSHIVARTPHTQNLERTDGLVLAWNCVPLPDGGKLLTYQDMTDSTLVERSLRAEKEALKEADNLKSNFLNNVSYELRSPLTSIKGFSEVLLKGYFGDLNDKQKDYIDGIHNSSVQLAALINDILDIATIDAGYMTLDVKEFDLPMAVDSILPYLKARAEENGLKFNFDCQKNIGKVMGDEKRIKQVISNLLNNAIRFTNKDDSVSLTISEQKDDIVIAVSDTGRGIPPMEQKNIFEKFYKATQGTRDGKYTGNALALPVVKSFIELHGGTIEMQSEEGKGTTITCRLKRRNRDLLNPSREKQKTETV